MDRADPRFNDAEYGDAMVRLARRVCCASLPVALAVGGGLCYLASRLSLDWLLIVGMMSGIVIYLLFGRGVCRVPWIYDFRSPVLVLRSFSDRSLKEGEYIHPPDEAITVQGGHDSYIWQLAESIWDLARVVTMQDEIPEGSVEPNAIVITAPDSNWRETVLQVARQSWIVLVIPATTPSCIEELLLLRDAKLLEKTLIYMPGTSIFARKIDHAQNWERIRAHLETRSLMLPAYDRRGMLYVPTEKLAVKSSLPCQHLSQARAIIGRLVPRESVLKAPLWNVVCFGNAYEGSDREKKRGGRLAGRIPIGASVFHVKGHGRVVIISTSHSKHIV